MGEAALCEPAFPWEYAMADDITLTENPVRVGTVAMQALSQSLEVSGYDELDILLGVIGLQGTGSPNVTVEVLRSNLDGVLRAATNWGSGDWFSALG